MDKFEYELKVEQIEKLVAREDFSTAKKIADSMEWKKEKDPKLLSHVAELYAQAGDIDKALKIYNYAYNASSRGLLVLERMTELAIIFGQLDLADELVEEYRGAGAYEPDYYMFKYQIAEGRGEDYVKRIPYLEKYCESELDEDAMYQLAWLYDRAGMTDKCVKMCDFIIDYFCFGENVDHAIALKLNHAELTEYQEKRVTNADEYKQSYEDYLKSQSEAEKREKSEKKAEEKIREDAIMEQQENDLGKQVSEIVEQNEREKQEINLKAMVAEEEAMARISFPTAASTVPEEPEAEEAPEEAESVEEALAGEIDAILSEEIPEEEKESSQEEVLDVLMKEIEAAHAVDENTETQETEKIELENIDELVDETLSKAEAKNEEETPDSEEISEEIEEQPEKFAEEPVKEQPEESVEEQLKELVAGTDKEAGKEDSDITIEEAIKTAAEELAEKAVPDAEIENIIIENIILEETEKAPEETAEKQTETEAEETAEKQTETEAEETSEKQTETGVEETTEEQTETVAEETSEEQTEEPVVESRKRVKRDVDFSSLDIVVPEGSFKVACSDIEMGVKYAIELVRLVPAAERVEHVARVSASRMNKGKFSSVEQQLDRDILLITNAGQLTNTSLDNIYAWMKKSMENKVIFVDDAGSLEELEKRRPKLMKRITGDYVYEKKDTAEWLDIVDGYVDENNCVLADDAYNLFEEYLNDKEEKNDVVLGITLKEAVQDALHMASKISVRNMISSLADTKYDEDGLLILRDRHFL